MDQRERFLRTMRFQGADHPPFWHPWLFESTLRRWRRDGLPPDADFGTLFDCDRIADVEVSCGLCPEFEERVVSEDDRYVVKRDFLGATVKTFREDPDESMPMFVDRAVKTPDDFRALGPRLQLNAADRFPSDWRQRCSLWRQRRAPLRFWGRENRRRDVGFFGPLRDLMGVEPLMYALYDDPAFVEEMMDSRADLAIAILERVLADTTIDFFVFWEDMACNTGPLISPEMFRTFLLPRYRRVTDVLQRHGVDIVIVDSDGDISSLIPLWLEAGVNGMLPFEVSAGMDVVRLRREYGEDLLMIGGFDKKVLLRGPAAIDAELERVRPVMASGGYIPFPDHVLPHDISLESFLHYLDGMARAMQTG